MDTNEMTTTLLKKRSNNAPAEDDADELGCCSGFLSARPFKSGKTQEKQSISPCTAHYQQYVQAVDLIESGSVKDAIPILENFLSNDDMDVRKTRLDPSLHNVLVKASIKLATAYHRLSLSKKAKMILDQILLPNSRLYVDYGHNLFGELSVIYASVVKGELESKRIPKITSETEFKILYVESCLSRLGRQLMKLGKFAPALTIFQTSLNEVNDRVAFSSYSSKQMYIEILLDQVHCHLALGLLSEAKSVLNVLQASERSLSLTFSNPKFLQIVKLRAAIEHCNLKSTNGILQSHFNDIPADYDDAIASSPECCFQTLCVPPDSSIETIRSSFRTLTKIIHPDKGGDTNLMQRLLVAHETLKDEGAREYYNDKCRVMHPNFGNQMIPATN
ncbi:hypothetical protein PCANC_06568 [Puccinia coronata f. sp. avenae]|uniref:J domain-containing protein n=1 Tax=Puccinia coronata f. sp. avenae TaxID=200324 RepID=A0A2N5VA93_9BASI|nr:hypothetical protein PCANC_06568 [Puccinia coronata f. sp. avenae]